MVREKADDIVAENIFGETLQRLLRANFDHNARALAIEGVQARDELDR